MGDWHKRQMVICAATLICLSGGIIFAGQALALISIARNELSPEVNLDPESLDFGDQVIKRKSPAKRMTVMNTGDASLYVKSASIEGDNWRDFSITKDTCTGASIDPGKACIVDVIFTPSETDERQARLKLIDNASDSPQEASLIGNGVNSIDISPL